MNKNNVFDQFRISINGERYDENATPKRQSTTEAKGACVRKSIDDIHEQRELSRLMNSFDEIGG
jgi:hypothetical protein